MELYSGYTTLIESFSAFNTYILRRIRLGFDSFSIFVFLFSLKKTEKKKYKLHIVHCICTMKNIP